MYVLLESLTLLALVAVVTTLLFAACVVLAALSHGVAAVWRIASKAADGTMAQQPELSPALQQATILTSTQPLARWAQGRSRAGQES